ERVLFPGVHAPARGRGGLLLGTASRRQPAPPPDGLAPAVQRQRLRRQRAGVRREALKYYPGVQKVPSNSCSLAGSTGFTRWWSKPASCERQPAADAGHAAGEPAERLELHAALAAPDPHPQQLSPGVQTDEGVLGLVDGDCAGHLLAPGALVLCTWRGGAFIFPGPGSV